MWLNIAESGWLMINDKDQFDLGNTRDARELDWGGTVSRNLRSGVSVEKDPRGEWKREKVGNQ